jgi:hypothetical protein
MLCKVRSKVIPVYAMKAYKGSRGIAPRDHWGDLGVDGWIILGWISRRWDVGMWTGLGWPRIRTGGVRLWVR